MTEKKTLSQRAKELQQEQIESYKEKNAEAKDAIEKLKTIVSDNLETIKEIIKIAGTIPKGIFECSEDSMSEWIIFGLVDSGALFLKRNKEYLDINADMLNPDIDLEDKIYSPDTDKAQNDYLTIRLTNGNVVNHSESMRNCLPSYVEIDLDSDDLSVHSNIQNKDVNMLKYLVENLDLSYAEESFMTMYTRVKENENDHEFVDFN